MQNTPSPKGRGGKGPRGFPHLKTEAARLDTGIEANLKALGFGEPTI